MFVCILQLMLGKNPFQFIYKVQIFLWQVMIFWGFCRDKSNTPSGFTLKLRKHIRTRRLEDVRQLGYDRV